LIDLLLKPRRQKIIKVRSEASNSLQNGQKIKHLGKGANQPIDRSINQSKKTRATQNLCNDYPAVAPARTVLRRPARQQQQQQGDLVSLRDRPPRWGRFTRATLPLPYPGGGTLMPARV